MLYNPGGIVPFESRTKAEQILNTCTLRSLVAPVAVVTIDGQSRPSTSNSELFYLFSITVQNCSIYFQGVYPNNSARLPNHGIHPQPLSLSPIGVFQMAARCFLETYTCSAPVISSDWHVASNVASRRIKLDPKIQILFLYTRIGSERGNPQSPIMYRKQSILTHSNGTAAPSRKCFPAHIFFLSVSDTVVITGD